MKYKVYSLDTYNVQRQQPGIQFQSPMWLTQSQSFGLSPADFQVVHYQKKWNWEPNWDSNPDTLIWNTGIPNSVSHYTEPLPECFHFSCLTFVMFVKCFRVDAAAQYSKSLGYCAKLPVDWQMKRRKSLFCLFV